MNDTMQYTTRNLTADESGALMRGLNLVLGGKHDLVMSVLRVIAEQGHGIFYAEPINNDCEGCGAAPGEKCRWACLSNVS